MIRLIVTAGRRVREFRKEAGLTQPQLADKVGVSLDTIGNIERDEFFTAA
ncbi:helix-turn-helix domain-containing protein [Ferrovibrio xuzhouensis]|uniref:Helix-turn-helix domain-containing protein n=1 Tax=Ferrovibrio xuzhouensis TaxID=1576914 RepID=A0ABV7VMU2_9PROT